MREIRIHLKDMAIALRDGPFEACYVRSTESEFACALEDMHSTRIAAHQILHDGRRTIG